MMIGPSGPNPLSSAAAAIEIDERPDAAVVHVHADIDSDIAAPLRQTLADAVDRYGHVVLDLTGATTVDPAGLAALVRAHQRARRREGTVCVVSPSRFVVTVLHTMRVDSLFPVFDDCPSALKWLRDGSTGTPSTCMPRS
jgi:anti-sigma B factor antagonist